MNFLTAYKQYKDSIKESLVKKVIKTNSKDLDLEAEKLTPPKDYIELAIMAILQKFGKNSLDIRARKFTYKDEYNDVWVLDAVVMQNDGKALGFQKNGYIEIGWIYRENGEDYGDGEPAEFYPLKDEDEDVKLGIFECVAYNLGMDKVEPENVWEYYDDNFVLDESVFNKIRKTSSKDIGNEAYNIFSNIEEEILEICSKHSEGNMMGNHCVEFFVPDYYRPTVKIKVPKRKRIGEEEFACGKLKGILWSDNKKPKEIKIVWSFEEPYKHFVYSLESSAVDYLDSLPKELQYKIFFFVKQRDKQEQIISRY